MDTQKINYFENIATDQHQEFVLAQSNCALCGSNLELQHMVDKISNEIKEEAHCPDCEIRARARIHPLN